MHTYKPSIRTLMYSEKTTKSAAFPSQHITYWKHFGLIVLECINFSFNSRHYLQVSAVSMGTKCAPTYANLVLDIVEKEFLGSITIKPKYWLRFIDDLFGIWSHTSEALQFPVAY